MPTEVIDELSINTIRTLAIDAVQKANSGHPGTPMGAAAMAYTIWSRFLRHNPANPQWPNRRSDSSVNRGFSPASRRD